MTNRRVWFLVLVLACLALAVLTASGYKWNTERGGTGPWTDGLHWDPQVVPGYTDQAYTSVTIDAPKSGLEASIVTITGTTPAINFLTIGPRTSLLPPDIVPENALVISSGAGLAFQKGAAPLDPAPLIVNHGVIKVLGFISSTSGYEEGIEVSGDGKIEMLGGRLSGQFTLKQPVEGYGSIQASGFFKNEGTITALNGTLVVEAIDAFINEGTLTRGPWGGLELTGWFTSSPDVRGSLVPEDGTISLMARYASQQVSFTNHDFHPGAYTGWCGTNTQPCLNFHAGNHIQAGAMLTLAPSSGFATIRLPGSHSLLNNGIIALDSTKGGTAKIFVGDPGGAPIAPILTGSGFLLLRSSSIDSATGASLVNEAGHTISGYGILAIPLDNRGLLIADGGWLTVSHPTTGGGTLIVSDTGTLNPLWGAATPLRCGTLKMLPLGVFRNSAEKIMSLTGNFEFQQTIESKWTHFPFVTMEGRTAQKLEVGGTDKGLTWNGIYPNGSNFAFKRLTVSGEGTRVTLVDEIDNGNRSPAEVLYTEALTVGPGATLNLNGLKLYAPLNNDVHRVVAGEGNLFGGGTIVDETGPPPLVFTDDPLQSGTTRVKAIHVTELRAAIDALRARHALGPFSWTDAALTPTTPVRAAHISEMRAALGQVYAAAAVEAPAYTDPVLYPGATPVKAAHLAELRAAVVVLW